MADIKTLKEIFGTEHEPTNEEYVEKVMEYRFNFKKFCEEVLDHYPQNFHMEWFSLIQQHSRVAITAPTGFGKCLAKGTEVLMYDGSIKKVEDVRVGDYLMGDDSKPRRVLQLGRGYEDMYEVRPKKGEPFKINQSHILSLKRTNDGTSKSGEVIDISTNEYLQKSNTFKHIYKGFRTGVELKHKETPFDPYLLGLWLSDGSSSNLTIYNPDKEVKNFLSSYCSYNNIEKTVRVDKRNRNSDGQYLKSHYLRRKFRELRLFNNKHIPFIFKVNSRKNRLRLLAGLLDGDGYLKKNVYEYSTKSEKLKKDFLFLTRSLGLAAYYKTKYVKGEKYYVITVSGDTHIIPCKIKRKKANSRKQKKDPLRFGFELVPQEKDYYYGFTLDGNGRFLLSDFTVTHNTSTIGNAYILWRCYFEKNKRFMIVSTSQPQSTKILSEIKELIENNELLRELMPSQSVKTSSWSKTWIMLTNGCQVMCKPLTENIKGYHVDYLLCDEAAEYPDHDMFFRYVVTRVNARNGKVVCISTPVSVADLMSVIKQKKSWVSRTYKAIYEDNEGNEKLLWPNKFDREKLAEIRDELGQAGFEREYLCNPRSQADSAVFPSNLLEDSFDHEMSFGPRLSDESFVFLGCDFAIATGPRADFDSYVIVERLGDKAVIRHGETWKGTSIQAKVQRIEQLYKQYKVSKIVIDPSNVGQAVAEKLREKMLPFDAPDFSYQNRAKMIINARQLFEEGRVVIPRYPEDSQTMNWTNKFINETLSFQEVRSQTTGHVSYQSTSAHDDTTMSFILGCKPVAEQRDFLDVVAM